MIIFKSDQSTTAMQQQDEGCVELGYVSTSIHGPAQWMPDDARMSGLPEDLWHQIRNLAGEIAAAAAKLKRDGTSRVPSGRRVDDKLRRKTEARKQLFAEKWEELVGTGVRRPDCEAFDLVKSKLGSGDGDDFGSPPVDEGDEFTHKLQLRLALVHANHFGGISVAAGLATSVCCSEVPGYLDYGLYINGTVARVVYQAKNPDRKHEEMVRLHPERWPRAVLLVESNRALLNSMLVGATQRVYLVAKPLDARNLVVSCCFPIYPPGSPRHRIRVVKKEGERRFNYTLVMNTRTRLIHFHLNKA